MKPATKAAPAPRFSSVTERPGQKAGQLQLQMLKARYGWAARQAQACDLLEVACGAGMGLWTLARVARSVAAGDLDPANLAEARATYRDEPRIALGVFDAREIPYGQESFDLVLLAEALYYVPEPARFFAEARRVLRPGGRLLITQVNPQWTGFNRSPFSLRYFTAAEFGRELAEAGFVPQVQAAFPERRGGKDRGVARVRRIAVNLRLIPRTMTGKALLKRLFYGRLETIPSRLGPGVIQPEELTAVADCPDLRSFRELYISAQKPNES